jgi:Fe-S-cluster-containing hydrogenase component 2
MEDCPIGAIYEEDGVYRIDKEQCTGCYLCVDACQRGALFVLDEEEAPLKCDLCGKCVDECTPKALLIE